MSQHIAYDHLSAEDKEAVNSYIYACILAGSERAKRNPVAAAVLDASRLIAREAVEAGKTETPEHQHPMTRLVEADIESVREVTASNPDFLDVARATYIELRVSMRERSGSISPTFFTDITSRYIDLDGDQFNLLLDLPNYYPPSVEAASGQ